MNKILPYVVTFIGGGMIGQALAPEHYLLGIAGMIILQIGTSMFNNQQGS